MVDALDLKSSSQEYRFESGSRYLIDSLSLLGGMVNALNSKFK